MTAPVKVSLPMTIEASFVSCSGTTTPDLISSCSDTTSIADSDFSDYSSVFSYDYEEEGRREAEAAKLLVRDHHDIRASQKAISHVRLLKEKAKSKHRSKKRYDSEVQTVVDWTSVKVNTTKRRKTINRQEKRRKIVTTEIALDNMITKYDSWDFFFNAQAPQTFNDYDDPQAEVDTTYEPSIYSYYCEICDWHNHRFTDDRTWNREEEQSWNAWMDSLVYEDHCPEMNDDLGTFDGVSEIYRDLRSETKAKNRLRKQKDRYYHFRGSRPEWVGKQCYDLTFTTPKVVKAAKKPANKRRSAEVFAEEEIEDPALITQLRNADLNYLSYDRQISLVAAGSTANTEHCLNGSPTLADGTIIASPILDELLEHYRSFAKRNRNCYPKLWRFFRKHPEAKLKLKVRTWTKKDNYSNSTNFTEHWNIGRRHHSRKLSWEARWYQKYKIREMGRNMKSRSRRVDAVGCQVDFLTSAGQTQLRNEESRVWMHCPCADIRCERSSSPYDETFAQNLTDSFWAAAFEEQAWWSKDQEQYVWSGDRARVTPNEEMEYEEDAEDDHEQTLRSDFGMDEVIPAEVNRRISQTALAELLADDWVLFESDTEDRVSFADIDQLSDLDEILVFSEWDKLSEMSSFD